MFGGFVIGIKTLCIDQVNVEIMGKWNFCLLFVELQTFLNFQRKRIKRDREIGKLEN